MSRPRKNTPEGDRALAKWRQTMQAKYGDTTKFFKEIGRKGGENGRGPDYYGGFAGNKQLAIEAGKKGGKIGRIGLRFIKIENNKAYYQDKAGNEVVYEVEA